VFAFLTAYFGLALSPEGQRDRHQFFLGFPIGAIGRAPAALPEVPSVGDFVPAYESRQWYGIGVPTNTPHESSTSSTRINAPLEMKAGLADGVPLDLPLNRATSEL
jgi:hypothetical protein